MDEFEFLDKQFHRLSEARQALARRDKMDPEYSMAECWKLAIQGSIKDYLKLRSSEGGAA